MNRIILVYGLISGPIIIGSMLLGIEAASSGEDSFYGSQAIGFLIMFIGFSLIFVATKKYRDQELGGVIKFKTAFKIGLGISLVGALCYIVGWETYLFTTDYAFITEHPISRINEIKESGASESEIQAFTETIQNSMERYRNIFFRIPITLTEILPMGLIISLISAVVFRNPNIFPASNMES